MLASSLVVRPGERAEKLPSRGIGLASMGNVLEHQGHYIAAVDHQVPPDAAVYCGPGQWM